MGQRKIKTCLTEFLRINLLILVVSSYNIYVSISDKQYSAHAMR